MKTNEVSSPSSVVSSKRARKTPDQRAFESFFKNGADFWSSEDGTLMALVIDRRADWAEVLQREFSHVFVNHKFHAQFMKPKFVYRHWVGQEWFDGSCGQVRGKIWTVTDEPTDFPVYEYDLVPEPETERSAG